MTRVIPAGRVAQMLGRHPSWFRRRRALLEAQGFPARDDLLGGWHADAVDRWLAARSGASVPGSTDERASKWARSA